MKLKLFPQDDVERHYTHFLVRIMVNLMIKFEVNIKLEIKLSQRIVVKDILSDLNRYKNNMMEWLKM